MAFADPGASSISVTGMSGSQSDYTGAHSHQSVSDLSQSEKLRNCRSSRLN
jgi:hypothetical protein